MCCQHDTNGNEQRYSNDNTGAYYRKIANQILIWIYKEKYDSGQESKGRDKMAEIILIILCVKAAKRFRAAQEKGVGKYIGGVWGSVGGGIVLGILFVSGGSEAGMLIGALIGYVVAFIIAISAMRAGKGYMESFEIQKAAEAKKAQEEANKNSVSNAQLAQNVAALQKQLASVQAQQAEASGKTARSGYPLFAGSGVCDVCNESLNTRKAYIVPNDVFYRSPKYREYVKKSPMVAMFGVPVDDNYFAQMKAKDTSPGSAVCEECIHLFE